MHWFRRDWDFLRTIWFLYHVAYDVIHLWFYSIRRTLNRALQKLQDNKSTNYRLGCRRMPFNYSRNEFKFVSIVFTVRAFNFRRILAEGSTWSIKRLIQGKKNTSFSSWWNFNRQCYWIRQIKYVPNKKFRAKRTYGFQ